jgi:hypothetical protein
MSADIRTSAINMPTSLREELACNQFNDQVGSQLHRGHDRGVIPANCAWLRPDLTIDSFWRKPAIRQAYDLGSYCPGFEPTAPRVEKLEP